MFLFLSFSLILIDLMSLKTANFLCVSWIICYIIFNYFFKFFWHVICAELSIWLLSVHSVSFYCAWYCSSGAWSGASDAWSGRPMAGLGQFWTYLKGFLRESFDHFLPSPYTLLGQWNVLNDSPFWLPNVTLYEL